MDLGTLELRIEGLGMDFIALAHALGIRGMNVSTLNHELVVHT